MCDDDEPALKEDPLCLSCGSNHYCRIASATNRSSRRTHGYDDTVGWTHLSANNVRKVGFVVSGEQHTLPWSICFVGAAALRNHKVAINMRTGFGVSK